MMTKLTTVYFIAFVVNVSAHIRRMDSLELSDAEDRLVGPDEDDQPTEHRYSHHLSSRTRHRRIPKRIVFCSSYEHLEEAPQSVQDNVNETLNLNRGYEVTWLGENTCADYVKQLNDERLLHLWHALDNSKYHKDFCRMTYLFNEGGGFSVEPETAPVVPFASMVEPDTTFVSVWSASESNAEVMGSLIGVRANSSILMMSLNRLLAAANQQYKEVEDPADNLQEPSNELRYGWVEDAPGWPFTATEKLIPSFLEIPTPLAAYEHLSNQSLLAPALEAGLRKWLRKCGVVVHPHVEHFRGCHESIRMFREIDVKDKALLHTLSPERYRLVMVALGDGQNSRGIFSTIGHNFTLIGYPRQRGPNGEIDEGGKDLHAMSFLYRHEMEAKVFCVSVFILLLGLPCYVHADYLRSMVPNDLNEYNMRNMWCAAFCTCSVLMTFSNKLVVQGNPVGIAAVQMLFSVVALLSLGPAFLELSSLKDVGVLVRWIPVPIFFVGMIVTSLSGFAHETITTCILMGSLRPIYAIPVEMFFLGERPSFEQVVGCLVLIVGTLIYVLGARSNAASVTLVGFLILCLNGIMAVGDRVYQRYLLHHQSIKASRLALVLANNLMGVVYIACIPPLYLHELPGMKRRVGEWIHGGDWADLSLVLVSCVAGFGIGYTGLGLQKLVTASTFLAISTGVRAFIVITDLAIMGTSAGGVAVFGLMVTIFGSVLCAMEDQAKKAKASAPPAAPEPAEDSEIAANPNPDSETAQTQQLLK